MKLQLFVISLKKGVVSWFKSIPLIHQQVFVTREADHNPFHCLPQTFKDDRVANNYQRGEGKVTSDYINMLGKEFV